MHKFDYKNQIKKLYTQEIVNELANISEFKGKQKIYLSAKAEVLDDLVEFAKINSTIYSNKIEGIEVDDKIANSLIKDQIHAKNRNEKEIKGYQNVLELIHESYNYIDVKPKIILQLHKELYKLTDLSFPGNYKTTDNIIQEIDKDGNRKVRFYTVPAVSTELAMQNMCENFMECWNDSSINRLLLSLMFILDFLCIHPFDDGNGRLSRLLTLLLLYKGDYIVGKYISIEKHIEKYKDMYYEALKNSSVGWHENKNDYGYFVKNMLSSIYICYKDLDERITRVENSGHEVDKPKIVSMVVEETLGKQTKKQIREKCPGISDVTIARTLSKLQKEGKVEKIGGGRYTYYVAKF